MGDTKKKKQKKTEKQTTMANERTMLSLPAGTLDKVKEAADSEGLSQSAWIRRLIFLGLEENNRRRGLI